MWKSSSNKSSKESREKKVNFWIKDVINEKSELL